MTTPRRTMGRMSISSLTPRIPSTSFFFFFNDTATTEIYTLSLHDALPIWGGKSALLHSARPRGHPASSRGGRAGDRKSTRLNSSHLVISYAVFCLKKKKKKPRIDRDHPAEVRRFWCRASAGIVAASQVSRR